MIISYTSLKYFKDTYVENSVIPPEYLGWKCNNIKADLVGLFQVKENGSLIVH